MEVFRDEMIYPTNAIEGLEEIFFNFVWDMYIDETDWGDPDLVVESDEEPYDFQGEVYNENYWEDSWVEIMEDYDIFHDMPINPIQLPSQETEENCEILNIIHVCKFDRVYYQIAFDLSDRDQVHVFPPPGERLSRYPTRVQLGAFPSLVSRNFDFSYSQVMAVVRYRLGGELRSCNSDVLYLRSGMYSCLFERRGVG